eukprot:4343024-Prymnesium_polylepis.1
MVRSARPVRACAPPRASFCARARADRTLVRPMSSHLTRPRPMTSSTVIARPGGGYAARAITSSTLQAAAGDARTRVRGVGGEGAVAAVAVVAAAMKGGGRERWRRRREAPTCMRRERARPWAAPRCAKPRCAKPRCAKP